MKRSGSKRFFFLAIFCLALVLGVHGRASAQDNAIYLNPEIADQGTTANKYSLAYYMAIAKARPRTIVLQGPRYDDYSSSEVIYNFSTSVSIPKNVTLVVENGARFKTNGSCYINFYGPIQAGSYQIFTEGTDARIRGSVSEAPVEWWGAHSIEEKDRVNNWTKYDSGPAIAAALRSSSHVVGSPGAVYLIVTPVQLPEQVTFDGKGCGIYGSPQVDSAMFQVKNKRNVVFKNMVVKLNGAKRFLYVFGSRDVTVDQVFLTEDGKKQNFTFFDIHNSYHCFLTHVTMNGGASQSDNGSVGVLIRSDPTSGGFAVVDNIGIDDSTIVHCWTGVLLDFDSASNNILMRNISIIGLKPTAPGAYYGIRSIGKGRIDFVNIDGIHIEDMPRGITFQNSSGYTIALRCARFSNVQQVFNLYGKVEDKMTVQTIDFRGTLPGLVAFNHLDATVKKLDQWNYDDRKVKIGKIEGKGRFIEP
jgi:hypothetical protein